MAWPGYPVQKESSLTGESALLDDYQLPILASPWSLFGFWDTEKHSTVIL